MSIVKMKKLRVFGMAADREQLLEELQHLGCVELSDCGDKLTEPDWQSLTRPDDRGAAEKKGTLTLLNSALNVLGKYAKEKGTLLRRRPVLTEGQLFDKEAQKRALAAAEELTRQEKKIAGLYSEESKLKNQKLSLLPFGELDVALDEPSTDEVSVTFGSLPLKKPRNGPEIPLEEALAAVTDLVSLTMAGKDQELQSLLVICHREVEESVFEVLKQYGFARSTLRDFSGTARENIARLDERLAGTAAELESAKEAIIAQAPARDDLRLGIDRVTQDLHREEARGKLLESKAVIFFEGWVPVPDVDALEALFARYICCWETEDPVEDEYPDVPVKLKSNVLTRPMNMVTEMYSLPAYGGVDPNPLMMPFFVFFFGFMFADLGYGLILAGVSIFVTLRLKPKGGTGYLFTLMTECGISSAIIGFFTGGFFADAIKTFSGLLGVSMPEIPFLTVNPVFDIMKDPMLVLILTLGIGLVQIIFGMGIHAYMCIKKGAWMDAIADTFVWWLVFIGIAVMALGKGPYVLYASLVAIVLTQGHGKKGIGGKLIGIVGSLYNNVTGYFGDVLSYSRLMVMMLAGSVIGQIFNLLGSMPGSMLVFIPIFIVGHLFNMGLNVIGTYVHTSRLQYLEFFGKFYEEGGKPFKPLHISTKYVDIKEEH